MTKNDENAAKDHVVHGPGIAITIVIIQEATVVDTDAVDQSPPNTSLGAESHRSIGMFLHWVLNTLHHFNIKP